MTAKVDFQALGPLEVHFEGQPARDLTPIRRRLLAILLARAGKQVTVDELVDALWFGRPPPTATGTLQVHIHRLRRSLGDPERIVRGTAGYQIEVGPGDYDVLRFADLYERANNERVNGRPEPAVDRLEKALSIWRGEPFAGIESTRLIVSETERLIEQRLAARRMFHELGLDLGRHHTAIAPLSELAEAHPYNERFSVLLMLALYRSGRHPEALEAYRAHRERLARELGVEPGELMRRVHGAVLRADERLAELATESLDATWEPVRSTSTGGGRGAVPRELPMPPRGFTGRARELEILQAVHDGPAPTRVALITGEGGVGKTALALHCSHRLADRFPDGQLYIDLRGHLTSSALDPGDALEALLDSLGVPPDHVPPETDRAAARYRSRIGDRRMLVMLDNAASADQVRPLLPGGTGSMTVVTSRFPLGDLVARNGAASLFLGPLPTADAHELVASLLKHGSEADPADIAGLTDQCSRLPLALRIAAAELIDEPGRNVSASVPVGEVPISDRIECGDSEVRATFESSYRGMPTEARRLFRLLGLVHGAHFSVEAAARLVDGSVEVTAYVLDRLVAAHLVERLSENRYRLHDLLRSYAEALAATEETGRLRAEAGAGGVPQYRAPQPGEQESSRLLRLIAESEADSLERRRISVPGGE